jgi:hypothetical protein
VATSCEKLRDRPILRSPVASNGPPQRVRNQQVAGSSPIAGSIFSLESITYSRLSTILDGAAC